MADKSFNFHIQNEVQEWGLSVLWGHVLPTGPVAEAWGGPLLLLRASFEDDTIFLIVPIQHTHKTLLNVVHV